MTRLHRKFFRSPALMLPLLVLAGSPLVAQTTSRWSTTPASTDWFDPLNWNNGVPNAPGDIAQVAGSTVLDVQVDVTAEATLGQLDLLGLGELTIGGAGPLVFNNPGDAPASIQTYPPRSTGVNATIATPLSIAGGEALVVNVVQGNSLTLSGGIVSTTGDVTKTGAGPLTLAGDSSGWEGNLTVGVSEVVVKHSQALGGVNGATTIDSGATLTFEAPSAEPMQLLGGRVQGGPIELSGPLYLGAPSQVGWTLGNASSGGGNSLVLSGPISGPGDLELLSDTEIQTWITGDNNYTGHTYLPDGQFVVSSSTGLGDTSAGTTISGGRLTLRAATQEPIRVEAGELRIETADLDAQAPVTLAGGTLYMPRGEPSPVPVIVDSAGGTLYGSFTETDAWTGGSTGTGDLGVFQINVDAPLAHNGGVVLGRVRLNTANTYTGDTLITDETVVNHPQAFGTAASSIRVDRALLTLNTIPRGARDLDIVGGTLIVNASDQPITSTVNLGEGIWGGLIQGFGVFDGPINYMSHAGGSSHDAVIAGGTFNGPIRGTTELRIGSGATGVIVLNAANELPERVQVSTAHVIVNDPHALTISSTHIQGGRVELNVPVVGLPFMTSGAQGGTLGLNADQSIQSTWFLEKGIVESNAEISFDRLLMYSSKLATTDTGSIEVMGEVIALGSSALDGKITGGGVIRAAANTNDFTLNFRGDLTEFDGQFVADRGFILFGLSGSENEAAMLNPASDLHVYPGGHLAVGTYNVTVENDIFLHNAHGTGPYNAALRYSGNGRRQTLAGRIDVGNEGSTITGGFEVTGTFSGNNLRVVNSSIDVRSPQEELRGVLRLVGEGGFTLNENASFHGLTEIRLENGHFHLGPSALTDRIGDATAIRSFGGHFALDSSRNLPTSETLGLLRLESGRTSVFASSDHGSLEATLTIDKIERERGALLHFDEAGNVTSTLINNIETFDGDMIGGWAVTDQGFASIDENGFVGTVQPTSEDINSAGPTDHILNSGPQLLTDDRVVASLSNIPTGQPQDSFDLGGHRLIVRSGGIKQSVRIVNGTLTAGDGQPAELFIYNTSRIEADIVDNGPDGSISLNFARESFRLTLSGNNRYTGGTWIHGDGSFNNGDGTLTIENLEAIPVNDRVYIEGGRYDLLALDSGTVKLAELHLRGNGLIQGFNAPIDADAYYLEHGIVNAPFSGDGVIYKDTDAYVEFTNTESPDFHGSVLVRDGRLSISDDSLAQADFFVQGGRLEVRGSRQITNSIALDGGELQGRFSGEIQVLSDSSLYSNGFTLLYGELSGDADLTINGTLDGNAISQYVGIFGDASEYVGDFNVESGSLRIGAPAQLGDGVIYVGEGARLIFGSNRPGDGQTRVSRDIHINHGTLYATPPSSTFEPDTPNGVATGDVYVHGAAFFGARNHGEIDNQVVPGLVFAGKLILDDDSLVIGTSLGSSQYIGGDRPLLEVSGQLVVGENNVWQLGTASLAITGTIEAGAPTASIDFQGVPSSLVIGDATLKTSEGKSLRITINGEARMLDLSGPDAEITGNGTYIGEVHLSNGAAVSPGESAGLLTIDGSANLGPGSRFIVELGGLLRGTQHDGLDVTGDVTLAGALELSLIDGFIPSPDDVFAILQAERIEGKFSNAAESIRIGDILFAVDYQASQVVLTKAAVVPEPQAVVLLLLGLTGLVAVCARKRCFG